MRRKPPEPRFVPRRPEWPAEASVGQVVVWTREPTYEKPDISVRATTLYYQIVAPVMLPFVEGRLLNLLRCRRSFFSEDTKRLHMCNPCKGIGLPQVNPSR